MRAFALVLLFGSAAYAADFTDQYGFKVTDLNNGMWQRGGITIGPMSQAKAQETMNAMQPDGYVAPSVTPVTISAIDFLARFTPAEAATLFVWNPSLVLQVSSAGMIDVTSPKLQLGIAAAVAAEKLTQARATQILNLAVPSP